MMGCADSSPSFTNSLGMRFSRIPAGSYLMGASPADGISTCRPSEFPQRPVRITHAFLMGRHEVTVGQFRRFVEATGYRTEVERTRAGANSLDLDTGAVVQRADCVWHNPGFPQTDEHPVVCVSQLDAIAFCAWLSETEGRRYRLPTEAEWEYACRAGTKTRFSTGNSNHSLQGAANLGDESLRTRFSGAWGAANWRDGHTFTAPVGSYRPNAFHLYDMHGNAGEWCADWFTEDYAALQVDENSLVPTSGAWPVVRGGSWFNTPSSCRSSGRHDDIPTAPSTTNGFRVVLEQERGNAR